MSAIAALLSVGERLDNLPDLPPKINCQELRDGVSQLRSELDRIKQFLSNADATNNPRPERVTQKITKLAYDIEDAMESAVVSATSKGKSSRSGAFSCFFKHDSKSLQDDLHIFERRIYELKVLMEAEIDDDAAAGSPREGERSSPGATLPTVETEIHQDEEIIDNPPTTVLVGREAEAYILRSQLLEGNSELSVIAICGIGGLGKTTLAKRIYNDPSVVYRFHNRAWATLSREFQPRNILETILSYLTLAQNDDAIQRMDTLELTEQLYKTQKGKRYLLVLDDLWSVEAWDTLKFAFPDHHNGSGIIITTRDMRVATYTSAHVLMLQPLSSDESWQIFKMKSRLESQAIRHSSEIERIGLELVKYCRGVPLATTVMGGNSRGKNLEDLKVMLRGLQRSLYLDNDLIQCIFEVIYHQLPIHLKPLFLYLGQFPEDQAIPVEKLCLLWIAEGLISTRALNYDNKVRTRMEVAEGYFDELVDRSLVILVEKDVAQTSTRFQSFQVHDLIRELCWQIGTAENLFEVIDFSRFGNYMKSSHTRRLAIYMNKSEDTNDDVPNITEAKYIRSILFFDKDTYLAKPFCDLSEFQGIRVLDYDGVDFRVKKPPRGIEKLIYLRHLSFRGCYLQQFPSSFSNLPFLETLDLRVRVSCIMTIPDVLRNLSSLRHLYFPQRFRGDNKALLKLDTLKKLEILENFHAGICDAEDLLQLQNLEILTVIVDGTNEGLKKTISYMKTKTFRHSSLVVKMFDSYSRERRSIVAELLECSSLHVLNIEGYLGESILLHGFGSNFTGMIFDGSEFCKDPMRILGRLPHLRSLVLCNDAFVGEEMVCYNLDFPQLRSLKLANLHCLEKWEIQEGAMPHLTICIIEHCDMEKWEIQEGAMPNLTICSIEHCDRLVMLPHGLTKITTLRDLMVRQMPSGFRNEVNEMVKEMKDLGNFQLEVTFHDC